MSFIRLNVNELFSNDPNQWVRRGLHGERNVPWFLSRQSCMFWKELFDQFPLLLGDTMKRTGDSYAFLTQPHCASLGLCQYEREFNASA